MSGRCARARARAAIPAYICARGHTAHRHEPPAFAAARMPLPLELSNPNAALKPKLARYIRPLSPHSPAKYWNSPVGGTAVTQPGSGGQPTCQRFETTGFAAGVTLRWWSFGASALRRHRRSRSLRRCCSSSVLCQAAWRAGSRRVNPGTNWAAKWPGTSTKAAKQPGTTLLYAKRPGAERVQSPRCQAAAHLGFGLGLPPGGLLC